MHVSFASEEQAIGLDFLRAANDALGDRFELNIRLGDSGATRWDSTTLNDEICKLNEYPVKMWVCGTPSMNQLFEKARDEILEDHALLRRNTKHSLENWLNNKDVMEVI